MSRSFSEACGAVQAKVRGDKLMTLGQYGDLRVQHHVPQPLRGLRGAGRYRFRSGSSLACNMGLLIPRITTHAESRAAGLTYRAATNVHPMKSSGSS